MEHLIELVRSESCLYDTNHPDYSTKTLKDILWAKIAKELSYKDGPSAKDAWQKLRNCHRDAIRRRNKIYKSGSATTAIKPWKFEKQMEFLVSHMTNPPATGSVSIDSSQAYDLIQPEDLITYPKVELEVATQQIDPLQMEIASHILPTSLPGSLPETSAASSPLPYPSRSQMFPKEVHSKESTTKQIDLNTLITRTLNNHEKRAKERAEKRALNRDDEDDLQQFFNTMYTITKKMPPLSQHKLKRKIFNLVSDEEEYLLNLRPMPIVIPTTPPSNPATPTPMAPCNDWMGECSEQYN